MARCAVSRHRNGCLPALPSRMGSRRDPAQDPVLSTPAVNRDDNRAQQNIVFQTAPPGALGVVSFGVFPQETVRERSIELTFHYSERLPSLDELRLHVPPDLPVRRIVGGAVTGGYTGDKPIDPRRLEAGHPCRDACADAARKRGCTVVVGGVHPLGRLRLDGVELRRPVGLTLEAMADKSAARRGSFAEVHVVEFGVLAGLQQPVPVGGLIIRLRH
jgi:hypothetical protein